MAILGTHTPRRCGIATFSSDLATALKFANCKIRVDSFAVSDKTYKYPAEVAYHFCDEDQFAYSFAGDALNRNSYDVLSIQHEYGIYGGEAGNYLLSLVREAKMPIVTTLHTILRDPSQTQKQVLDELLQLSTRVVVMSQTGMQILSEVHGIPMSKVDFIPHGIPQISSDAGKTIRQKIGGNGPILLTFGLLSPDKGLQNVIKSLPPIVEQFPGTRYIIVGATHPNIVEHYGESYRQSLIDLAGELGLQENVIFVNEFVSLEDLKSYLSATDYYITPYLNPKQITSGTLAYSMGAGKVVISTPYEYAKEVLANDRGILVPFNESDPISTAILESWTNDDHRSQLQHKAMSYGSTMYWDRVGELYLESFDRARNEVFCLPRASFIRDRKRAPDVSLEHLQKLTDDTGILQHATYSVPNRAEGYCTDDNARALILTAQLESSGLSSQLVDQLQSRYLSFLADSFNPATGKFRNFMDFRRNWLEDSGSEDSQGRALWGLGIMVAKSRADGHNLLAQKLFENAAHSLLESTSPRTWVYASLGAVSFLHTFPNSVEARTLLEQMSKRLFNLHQTKATQAWPWLEPRLAYSNARVPQALIWSGVALFDETMLKSGLEVLDWLLEKQTAPSGCFSPVGVNGAGPDEIGTIQFDQQPIEVCSTVSACISASKFGDTRHYLDRAHWCFDWFLGQNVVGVPVADPVTGACYDGLTPHGVNLNQGAESTLSYLSSLLELRGALNDRFSNGKVRKQKVLL